ncbi:MAG TPA: hypothetical protein VL854_05625 [Nitrososphaeraceae archaeon]|jgi:hypothetical protein|nr:hypothetical protein [Nitrososphaeraceae archaeon]
MRYYVYLSVYMLTLAHYAVARQDIIAAAVYSAAYRNALDQAICSLERMIQ